MIKSTMRNSRYMGNEQAATSYRKERLADFSEACLMRA
jgi:hypothetical protein